jgi:Arc/MetJ family transcription regulator
MRILMHMRTTLNIDDDLLRKAAEATGIRAKTDLVHAGLDALVQREAARRLIALGGTMPGFKSPPRRRPKPFRTKRRP